MFGFGRKRRQGGCKWIACDGGGYGACSAFEAGILGASRKECPKCNGTGKLRLWSEHPPKYRTPSLSHVKCPYCGIDAGFITAYTGKNIDDKRALDPCPGCGKWFTTKEVRYNTMTGYNKLSKYVTDKDKGL